MTWTRTPYYTISGDFGGNYNPAKFKNEIAASSIVTATVLDTGFVGDDIYITFDVEPTGGEKTTLDGLIGSHDSSIEPVYDNIISLTPKESDIIDTDYKRQKMWIFEGSKKAGNIEKIMAIGHMDAGVTNFSIEVFDSTNALQIAEATFTDTTPDSELDLGTISNVPTGRAKIEINVKKTGGTDDDKAHLEDISFYL